MITVTKLEKLCATLRNQYVLIGAVPSETECLKA